METMINLIVLGFLMENSTPMWFPYLLLGESVITFLILCLVCTVASLISRLKNTFKDVKTEIRSEDQDNPEHKSFIAESELNEKRL